MFVLAESQEERTRGVESSCSEGLARGHHGPPPGSSDFHSCSKIMHPNTSITHPVVVWSIYCAESMVSRCVNARMHTARTRTPKAGVIHRDLKPENVLMDMRNPSSPVPVVMDFETSKVQALSGVTTTTFTAIVGSAGCVHAWRHVVLPTPRHVFCSSEYLHVCDFPIRYTDPKVLSGDTLPSEASDMYSFGVIMSEMLTGEPTPQRAREAVESKVHARDANMPL